MLPSLDKFETATPIDTQIGTSVDRLSALCQAVPSLLVAGEVSGKRLMEVVINGELVRAADGNGLRAFTMASDGIRNHARLFDVQNLQNLINTAAIWQIASVVVAQKHLADISKKLDEIKNGVLGISKFLDNQRKSRIHSTYSYLEQIHQSLQSGELPTSARHHLENCERDLLEIQHHLELEYRQKAEKKVEHRESFGTKVLTADISAKIQELDLLASDMMLCLITRITAWHVLCLFPGEPKLKLARRASIFHSIETFASLVPFYTSVLFPEIYDMKSSVNRDDTLTKRRISLYSNCSSSLQSLEHSKEQVQHYLEQCDQLILNNDRPMCLLLQFENGMLVDIRQPL